MIGKNLSFFDYFLSMDNLKGKNQSFFNYFLSKDNLTGKNQSFFDYFLSKNNLTGKNQSFFDYFLSKDNVTDKNQSFFHNFFSKDAMTGKNQIFFNYILSKDDLTGKNQIFFDNFIWNLRTQSALFLWKKILFLSITIFSPDFYQLARLAEQNNSFLCKIFDQFFTYTICIWWKESIFCQKKWYISNLKKIVFMSRHSRIVGTISSASDFNGRAKYRNIFTAKY